jgi:DNA invertase Pin-like site-specific DNA recombinase
MWFKKRPTDIRAKAIAYYRHSAEDRQENSIPIQKEQVRRFAEEHGVKIIEEFEDAGKSGLTAERRDGFKKMIEKIAIDPGFEFVLALDVSRWGRFQNVDLFPYYKCICNQYGKEVVFTSIGMPKTDDLSQFLRLQLEGYLAAEYSRVLSDKVFKGCVKIVEQGFHAGGMPPYGLHRLLVDEQRNPVQILERGQRKSIQNQRVKLVPGDKDEVRKIERIFADFVRKKKSPLEIATTLNEENIPSPGKKKWSSGSIRSILTNESYIGTIVYNKTGQRLLSKTKRNPKAEWIRNENAFPPTVNRKLFDQAQAIFKKQREEYFKKHSVEDMVSRLKSLYDRFGFVTARQISSRKDMLSPGAYTQKFHSLGMAFQKMFSDVLFRATRTVEKMLRAKATSVERFGDYYVLNDILSVLVQPSLPVPFGYQAFWAFRPDPRIDVDITLGVPLGGGKGNQILGFLVFPRLLVPPRSIRLFSSSEGKLDLHGYADLGLIEALLA